MKYAADVQIFRSGATKIQPGEYAAGELLEKLRDGERIIGKTEMLGTAEELTLEFDRGTYYCNTQTMWHKHETQAEMRACMEQHGYVTAE